MRRPATSDVTFSDCCVADVVAGADVQILPWGHQASLQPCTVCAFVGAKEDGLVVLYCPSRTRTLATECDKGFDPGCGGIAVLICAMGAACLLVHRVGQIIETMAQTFGSEMLQPEPLAG